jgi:choline dehydrogenase/4-pyridoxate dehydrogenase
VAIKVKVLVTRILLEGTRAVGIEYVQAGSRRVVRAEREVILCGGVINSPQLLMLSGIGEPEELRAHGIEVEIPLPGVGKNLQDHISSDVSYVRKQPGPVHGSMRFDRIALALANAYVRGKGIASDVPGGVMAFLKTAPDVALPDIQLLFNAAPVAAAPYLSPFTTPYADGFGCRAVLLRPQSRGDVRLASADPASPLRIRQNFLATDNDWGTLRAGLRVVRDIGRQSPLQPFVEREIGPGPTKTSDADIDAHIRLTGRTVHHPIGTCKMGNASDPTAVVDPALRVLGAEGLRVVDASVMPDLVGGNINAVVIMIAEKAADFIRGRAQLTPIQLGPPARRTAPDAPSVSSFR